jgi:hypothetical protein
LLGEAHGFGGFLFDRAGRLVVNEGKAWLYTTQIVEGQWESWVRTFDVNTLRAGPARRGLVPVAGHDRAVLHHVVAIADDLVVGFYCDGIGISAGIATAPDADFIRDPTFVFRPEAGWERRGDVDTVLGEETVAEKFQAIQLFDSIVVFYESRFKDVRGAPACGDTNYGSDTLQFCPKATRARSGRRRVELEMARFGAEGGQSAFGRHLAESGRSAPVKGFGCRQAYESLSCRNPRATGDGYGSSVCGRCRGGRNGSRPEVVWFRRRIVHGRRRGREQLAGSTEICLAGSAGEQAVVTDAMEAARQDMEQEAADELVGRERHDVLPVGAVAAIVLVAEGDAALVEGDQTAVRDGDPVGVARQIGKHRFRKATSAASAGSVNTTWKYPTGRSPSRSASHARAAAPWHFGQCRLRQLLAGDTPVAAVFAGFDMTAQHSGATLFDRRHHLELMRLRCPAWAAR